MEEKVITCFIGIAMLILFVDRARIFPELYWLCHLYPGSSIRRHHWFSPWAHFLICISDELRDIGVSRIGDLLHLLRHFLILSIPFFSFFRIMVLNQIQHWKQIIQAIIPGYLADFLWTHCIYRDCSHKIGFTSLYLQHIVFCISKETKGQVSQKDPGIQSMCDGPTSDTKSADWKYAVIIHRWCNQWHQDLQKLVSGICYWYLLCTDHLYQYGYWLGTLLFLSFPKINTPNRPLDPNDQQALLINLQHIMLSQKPYKNGLFFESIGSSGVTFSSCHFPGHQCRLRHEL